MDNFFPVIDFPKIHSPFVRKEINGHYVVTPEITPGYEWVFNDSSVRAVDKLHGTNICVHFKNGTVSAIDNRDTRVVVQPFISLYSPKHIVQMMAGIINSMEKGWISDIETGSVYGELIGPSINKNFHRVDRPYFIPFDWLYEKCEWKSWSRGQYLKNFESISDWFKEMPSLFTENRIKQQGLAEGVVFTHPDGRMAKLRRDMFPWYHNISVKGVE